MEEHPMNDTKYVGMDVHLATISCVVLDHNGKILMSTVLQTKAELIISFLQSLKGTVEIVFEEGTLAQWMFEITREVVHKVVVCNVRKTFNKDQKSDKRDAQKLARLLRLGEIKGVYHHRRQMVGEIKQLVCIYNQLTTDRTRIINRFRSVFREQALQISLRSEELAENLKKLPTKSHRLRAKFLYAEMEAVSKLRDEARVEMVKQARRHKSYKLLQTIPGVSEIRAAQLLAWVVTPHRFRTKKQFWSYCGLSVITQSSSDYEVDKKGSIVRSKKNEATYGLTREYHHGLKELFKAAALSGIQNKQVRKVYEKYLERGLKEPIAQVQLARKLAAGCLAVWKSGKEFEIERLISD
jgi:transposase